MDWSPPHYARDTKPEVNQYEIEITCPSEEVAKEAVKCLQARGFLVRIKKVIEVGFVVVILIVLPGCIATDDQLDKLVQTINTMKDATVKAINDNQGNQAKLAQEHLELTRDLYDDAEREQKPIAKPLHDRLVKAAVIADKAEELANVSIADAKKPENPISGLLEAILAALMNNPTMSGLMALITGLAGQQFMKIRSIKKERAVLYAKTDKLKQKVVKVALQKPEDVDIEEELKDV